MVQKNDIISYEASKWYIKMWRQRWYLYAIFLHIKLYLNVELLIDYLLNFIINVDYEEKEEKKIKSSWKDIKRHIELSKMYKFSSKYEREE